MDSWIAFLQTRAAETWGPERAAELEPALLRMAEALRHVAARAPRAESVPYGAGPPDARGDAHA